MTSLLFSILILTQGTVHDGPVDPREKIRTSMKICGPKCLYALLCLQGHKVNFGDVLDSAMKDPDGSSLDELSAASIRFGLATSVVKSTTGQLKSLPLPAILHLKNNDRVGHFVVLCSIREETCRFIDGTSGEIITTNLGQLVRSWSGYALVQQRYFDSAITQGALALFAFGASVTVGKTVRSMRDVMERGRA